MHYTWHTLDYDFGWASAKKDGSPLAKIGLQYKYITTFLH